MKPLADRLRPTNIDEVFGQEHLLKEGKLLRNVIEKNEVPNMIFYGPSGVGKTTVANIIANKTGKQIHRLNATTASVSDIRDIVKSLDGFLNSNGVLLYLDEIQHFNKKQQQSLLEFMENGSITLIASTTENPYFYVYNAVLSRSVVFEFKPLTFNNIKSAVLRAVELLRKEDGMKLIIDDLALEHICRVSSGDVRKALNSLEISIMATSMDQNMTINVTDDIVEQATGKRAMRHDKDGDSHYDVVSAFQKSMRGSDANAAVFYLAKLLEGGDMDSAMRRMMVCACEDVGLAYPQIISIVKSAIDAALMLGMPEARIPLSNAVILIANSPKSNSAINAIDAALEDVRNNDNGEIPNHLKDTHYEGANALGHGTGYLYPHVFDNHFVEQQYLPDKIKDKIYYEPSSNKSEKTAEEYWKKIKKNN